MGCLSSKYCKTERILNLTTTASDNHTISSLHGDDIAVEDLHLITFNILHSDVPFSIPHSCSVAFQKKAEELGFSPAKTEAIFLQLFSIESIRICLLRHLGSSRQLARVSSRILLTMAHFGSGVGVISSREEELCDMESIQTCSDIILDDGFVTCHSSVLDSEDEFSPTPHKSHLPAVFPLSTSAKPTFDDDVPCRGGWITSPYLNTDLTLQVGDIFSPTVPSRSAETSSGVVSPAHLVAQHHQCPAQNALHLPRLQYPGTLVAATCFSSLQHLAIGCIGLEPDASVTDFDMAVVVDTLGPQLISLRLMKLNGLSVATLAMVTANCARLSVLVVFGCDGMRVKEKNKVNIQRAFESFEEERNVFPRIVVPLNGPTYPLEGGYVHPQQARGGRRELEVLDLRYSLDLTDDVLTEIMNEFDEIGM